MKRRRRKEAIYQVSTCFSLAPGEAIKAERPFPPSTTFGANEKYNKENKQSSLLFFFFFLMNKMSDFSSYFSISYYFTSHYIVIVRAEASRDG